jgi:predicted phage tail component-like protein
LNLLTFNFCGVDAVTELDLIVTKIRIPVTPEINEYTQDVPGMLGKVFLGNSYGQKIFEIDVIIKASNASEQAQKIQDLTNLVMTFGTGEYPMVFSNISEYTYYGHFNNISTPEEIIETSHWMKSTLTFACSDPKGYGEYESNDMTQNPMTITPNGKAECYPIFTCLPNKDIKKIAVTDEDGTYVFIGADIDPGTGQEDINKEPLVFHDTCNDLSKWTKITSTNLTWNLDNGSIGGEMRNTTDALRPALVTVDGKNYENFGNPVAGDWHGPVRLQWLPGSYDDYRIQVRMVNQQTYARANGRIDLFLLDANGERIGKIMLKDTGSESKIVYAQAQLGSSSSGTHKDIYYGAGKIARGKTVKRTIKVGAGTKTVTTKGVKKTVQLWKTVTIDEDLDTSAYTNFYGHITLQKIGNKYRVEIMKLNNKGNPAWSKPVVVPWTDTKKTYNKALAGIALYTAKYDIYEDTTTPITRYKNNDLCLADVRVWNIIDGGNGVNSTLPKVIAHKGDEIKINCEDHTIYKNGAVWMKNLYIGSDFPIMQGGIQKTFAFEPSLTDADWYFEYLPTIN